MRVGYRKKLLGFNLIEILVVIVIIGIVLAIAVPTYNEQITRSKLAKIQSISDQISRDLQNFYSERGRLPTVTDRLSLAGINAASFNTYYPVNWGVVNTVAWSRGNTGSCDYFWVFFGIDNSQVNLTSVDQLGMHLLARVNNTNVRNVVAFSCGPFNTTSADAGDLSKFPKACSDYAGTFVTGGTCP